MTDWPHPIEVRNPDGMSDIVLLCEHASRHIPAEYKGLGVAPHDLMRHIAWDIGAAEVTRQLSDQLEAPAYLGTYSRLMIDLNRPLDADSSIVTRSEATDIPANHDLGNDERQRRAEQIFNPYHDHVRHILDQRQISARPTRLVCIHSFTPVYLEETRIWHGGVLFGDAREFGEGLVARLQSPGLNLGANVPYQTSRTDDYSVPVHGDDRGIPAVLVEIRQDLISDAAGVAQWVDRLAMALN